jgi:hypothetical protein
MCSNFSSSAITWMQLMQQDVQKSMTTNLFLKCDWKDNFTPSLVLSQFKGPFSVSSGGKSNFQGSF